MSISAFFSSRKISTEKESSVSIVEHPHIYVERTLAIIKPDAVEKESEIEDIILKSGFQIAQVCFTAKLSTCNLKSSNY